jgi:hypothetical protein
MIVCGVIGLILLLIAGITFLTSRKNMRRRARVLNTPTTPIAQSPGGRITEIKGRIVPSERGVVQAPISGRYGVWVRVTVQEQRRSGRNTYWATVIDEAIGQPFMVDDGSGEYARVEPQNANVMLDSHNVASSGTFNDAHAHIEAFLQSRGVQSTGFFGFNKQMRFNEEIMAPEEVVYALGPARRDPGPPAQTGYRGGQSTQLTFFAHGPEDGELLISNKPEHEIVSKLHYGFIAACIMGGLGLVSLFGAAALGVLELLG